MIEKPLLSSIWMLNAGNLVARIVLDIRFLSLSIDPRDFSSGCIIGRREGISRREMGFNDKAKGIINESSFMAKRINGTDFVMFIIIAMLSDVRCSIEANVFRSS